MSPLTLGFAILWAFLLSQTTCCYCPPVFKFDVPSSMQSLNLFFPSPAFWNIFQYLMFKKSLGFWRICLFLLNKKKYNIWGVWKQTEILVTDTVLVLSLQTRIQNIFLFFLDVFFRAIHSIYGYIPEDFSPKHWTCMQILPPSSGKPVPEAAPLLFCVCSMHI